MLSLGVRGEVVDELPTDLVRGLPELRVLYGDTAVKGESEPLSLPSGHWRSKCVVEYTVIHYGSLNCPLASPAHLPLQLWLGTEPGESAHWELDRLV